MNREKDTYYLQMAIDESRRCEPSDSSYSVGAVIVAASGGLYKGYTRETGAHNHAEEEALAKALAAGAELSGAVMYSSMEPCSVRKSKPKSCSALIIEHGFGRVVYALAEPPHFVECHGRDLLREAGIEVEEVERMAAEVLSINSHILG